MPMIRIYVGTPEQDRQVTVNTEDTVQKVIDDNRIVVGTGSLQHNRTLLNQGQRSKTLGDLNVVDGDSLYVVQKLANA